MSLQAAIDDSGSEPNQGIYVLAGFLSTAERWVAFAPEWQEVLGLWPKINNFKYSEAMRLKGQFAPERGWTETLRDERLKLLAEVIRRHVSGRFHASLYHEDYQLKLRDHVPATSRTLVTDTPFCRLAGRCLVAAAMTAVGTNLSGEMTVYFDTQPGQDVDLTALWPLMAERVTNTPIDLPVGLQRPTISSQPHFVDEKDWVPIQAADMLAGARRAELMAGIWPSQLRAIHEIDYAGFHLGEAELCQIGCQLAADMKRLAQDHPGIPLVRYDPATAARTRKRARQGKSPRQPRRQF